MSYAVTSTDMDPLLQSRAKQYPHSIARPNECTYVLDSYASLFRKLQPKLFGVEERACINLWQCQLDGRFRQETARNLVQLESHFDTQDPRSQPHPQCRFIFINAHNGSSQERLNITSQMMNDTLTYHQIMPPFVDLMASFGRNAADDFQYCGFRSEARLSTRNIALAVPELGRSGQVLEICYSLRAVEPSTSIPGSPWSIKQLAIAHTFDVKTGQSAWVVLKADNLIKDRIMSATRSAGLPDMNSYQDVDESLASSLTSHLVFCEWAAEHWRWYVNFLEQEVQDITGTTTFSNITAPSCLGAAQRAMSMIAPVARLGTFPFFKTLSRISTWGSIRRNSRPSKGSDSDMSGSTVSPTGTLQSGAAEAITEKDAEEEEDGEEHSFSLKDIQRLQFIEDKINEAILVQTTIIKVLEQLRTFYASLQELPEWPTGLSRECKGSLARFNGRLGNIEFDLNLQVTRAKTLATLLANRKTLVSHSDAGVPPKNHI